MSSNHTAGFFAAAAIVLMLLSLMHAYLDRYDRAIYSLLTAWFVAWLYVTGERRL